MAVTSASVSEYYLRRQAQTAPRKKRVYMLHVRCVELLMMARMEIGDKKRRLLNDAQNIIYQLQLALKITDEVSESLFYLYDYCYGLLESGSNTDVVNTLVIITKLKDTFHRLLYF